MGSDRAPPNKLVDFAPTSGRRRTSARLRLAPAGHQQRPLEPTRAKQMRYAAVILTLAVSSLVQAGEYRFECKSIAGLPNDLGSTHPSDIEQKMFRAEYRSPSDPMTFTVNGNLTVRQDQAHLSPAERQGTRRFEGRLLSWHTSGRIWFFTTDEFPDGTVEYVFDSNRGVLIRTNTTFNYARGYDAPPETGKVAVSIYVYGCSVSFP